jgi:hypothetical protein
MLCLAFSSVQVVCGISLLIELLFWPLLWFGYRTGDDGCRVEYVYFNPQDWQVSARRAIATRLPIESQIATFGPLLKQYIGVTKLLVTVAAASISFATAHNSAGIYCAKLFLAWSIAYGLMFCITAVYCYESYLHNLESYKPRWAATVESLGVSSLFCFLIGYGVWAFQLRP